MSFSASMNSAAFDYFMKKKAEFHHSPSFLNAKNKTPEVIIVQKRASMKAFSEHSQGPFI
jgi:hypothetical protein